MDKVRLYHILDIETADEFKYYENLAALLEEDEYIEENFNDIVGKVSDTGILIGNLGWIKQFQDAGVTVYGDYGLNAYNSQAVKAYEELGVKMLYLSHEKVK